MNVLKMPKPLINEIFSKLFVCGKIIELYQYEKPIITGLSSFKQNKGRSNQLNTTQEQKQINRNKTLSRAKTNIKRLANTNTDLNKFFTLTFKDNITNIKTANKLFKDFILRLNYYIKINGLHTLKYINVIEFQDKNRNGVVHYHTLCNLPYIQSDTLSDIWQNGFIKINKIDNVDNIGAYITKYMQKDLSDKRLLGHRSYMTSKNLLKPIEITNNEQINNILSDITNVNRVYNSEYISDYNGTIHYTQLTLNNALNVEPIGIFNRLKERILKPMKQYSPYQLKITDLFSLKGLTAR